MITKEMARLIFNCYTEIENGQKMIEELKKCIDDNGDFLMRDSWGNTKNSLELRIPTGNGYSIKQLPVELGIEAIKAHIEDKEKQLEKLKVACKTILL